MQFPFSTDRRRSSTA